jgi:hypothetical protein
VDAGNLTRLSWAPPSDQTNPTVAYRVYAKTVYEPRFFPVGTTANLFLDTDHAWAENNSIPERVYFVTTVAENGTESFFSDAALNNDRDHDGLTDALETELGTDINTPDTDNDGLTDGEEYWTYGTDPLLADTDDDGYSDFIEIMAGSDPLDPDSIPLKGDISGDHRIDLDDAIIGLQIMTGIIPSELGALTADINDDGKIGIVEVIYILEEVGGLQ